MSQYTPSTYSIESAYCHAQQETLQHRGPEAHVKFHAEFRAWLAEELRQAKETGWDEAESQDHLQGDWSDELKMTCYDDHNPYRSQP